MYALYVDGVLLDLFNLHEEALFCYFMCKKQGMNVALKRLDKRVVG